MTAAEAPAPRLSAALVTRNRPASLERTLASLRAQDAQPWEVLVSDDSDPEVAIEVRRLAERFDCRYVHGPRRGLYANRNHAALACRGSQIRTIDDDHEFPDGHLRACLAAIERDSGAIWIIGERTPDEPLEVGSRCPPQLHPRGFSVTPPPGGRIWAVADGATIYPSLVFERGLRFVEDFPFGASYLEWGSRLNWLGYTIRHLRQTHVVHHYDPATRSYLDADVDLAARLFASFSHVLMYQPSRRNRLLCAAEVLKQFLLDAKRTVRAVRWATAVYRRRRSDALAEYRSHRLAGQGWGSPCR